ncbi:MAG: DUF559 domain-containing protein [Nanoarchaeota archaeon]
MFKERDLEIVKQNHGKKTLYEILGMLEEKLTYGLFKKRCRKLGFVNRRIPKTTPPKEIKNAYWNNFDYLNNLYTVERKGPIQIAKLLNVSASTIKNYLKINKVKMRKYAVNEVWSSGDEKRMFETRLKMSNIKKSKMTEEKRKRLREVALKARINQGKNKGPSSIEIIVHNYLNNLKILYKKQEPIYGFLIDIFMPSLNLIIECDGDYWHSLPKTIEKDNRRDLILSKNNYNLLRLKESDIRNGKYKEQLTNKLNELFGQRVYYSIEV